jgi:hypothetical protein
MEGVLISRDRPRNDRQTAVAGHTDAPPVIRHDAVPLQTRDKEHGPQNDHVEVRGCFEDVAEQLSELAAVGAGTPRHIAEHWSAFASMVHLSKWRSGDIGGFSGRRRRDAAAETDHPFAEARLPMFQTANTLKLPASALPDGAYSRRVQHLAQRWHRRAALSTLFHTLLLSCRFTCSACITVDYTCMNHQPELSAMHLPCLISAQVSCGRVSAALVSARPQ